MRPRGNEGNLLKGTPVAHSVDRSPQAAVYELEEIWPVFSADFPQILNYCQNCLAVWGFLPTARATHNYLAPAVSKVAVNWSLSSAPKML